MDESFDEIELVTSALPKPIKKYFVPRNKGPSRLALKKPLRRSSMYDKLLHSTQNSHLVVVDALASEESCDTVSSSSISIKDVKITEKLIIDNSTQETSLKNHKQEFEASVVIIESTSEEEDDENDIIPGSAQNSIDMKVIVKDSKVLSQTKFESVKNWVNNINANAEDDKTKQAINSTFALDKTCLPFDEWIKEKYKDDKKAQKGLQNKENSNEKTDNRKNVKSINELTKPNVLKDKSLEENKIPDDKILDTKSKKKNNNNLVDFEELERRKARNNLLFNQLKKQVTESTKKKEINSHIDKCLNILEDSQGSEEKSPKTIYTTPNITRRRHQTKKSTTNLELPKNNTEVFITPAKQVISKNEEISDLLDKLYGNSWHKNKEEILSETKSKKKLNFNKLKEPQTEKKKSSKGLLYPNPYLDSERAKSNNLLKSLHKARLNSKDASPYFKRPDFIDDDTPSPSPKQSTEDSNKNRKYAESNLEDDYLQKKKNALPKPIQLKFIDDTPSTNKKSSTKSTSKKMPTYSTGSNSDSDSDSYFSASSSNTRKPKSISSSNSISPPLKTQPKKRVTSKSNKKTDKVSPNVQDINLNKKTPFRRIKTFSSDSDPDYSPALPVTDKNPTLSSDSKPERPARIRAKSKHNLNRQNDLVEQLQNITLDDDSYSSSDDEDDVFTKPETPKPRATPQKYQPKEFSFLASLSKNIPDEQCNPSALIYKKNFTKHRDALAKKLFDLFNDKIFGKCIPEDTPIQWSGRMTGTAGYCSCLKKTHRDGKITRCVRLQLSTKVLDSADRLRDTLVHEMCHAATFIVNQISDGHGSFWKSWASKAMQAFPELPPIKRCHDYDINYKYTYKCMSCNYSFGRHSKSLNLEKKRCGYCYGKFEVLINKTYRSGDKKSVPCTPKVSGFAKFVKENYGLHKSPGVNHAELMRYLGKKYQEVKTSGTT